MMTNELDNGHWALLNKNLNFKNLALLTSNEKIVLNRSGL